MNDLERAVIEAARAFYHSGSNGHAFDLNFATAKLIEHERALKSAGLAEIPWAQVADGDELRGKSGEFYPVVATKREWRMGTPTGNFLITVKVGGKDRVLTRSDGQATVRRGAAGAVVDTFVHVFKSGDL